MSGFDGESSLELAPGSVFGLRSWTLPFRLLAETPKPELRGNYAGIWERGVNQAVCKATAPCAPESVPRRPCGCGFWAYWQPEAVDRSGVSGVVEGFGRTLIGTRGFRAEKARIVALTKPAVGRLLLDTVYAELLTWQTKKIHFGEFVDKMQAQATAAVEAVTEALALAYDVPVYDDVPGMLAQHPLTDSYLPATRAVACQYEPATIFSVPNPDAPGTIELSISQEAVVWHTRTPPRC